MAPIAILKRDLINFARGLGALRVALVMAAIAVILLRPAPGTVAIYTGWSLIPTALVPVFAPIVLMVLLLDTLMSRIFMADSAPAEHHRFKRIITINLALATILVLYWIPYYRALGATG